VCTRKAEIWVCAKSSSHRRICTLVAVCFYTLSDFRVARLLMILHQLQPAGWRTRTLYHHGVGLAFGQCVRSLHQTKTDSVIQQICALNRSIFASVCVSVALDISIRYTHLLRPAHLPRHTGWALLCLQMCHEGSEMCARHNSVCTPGCRCGLF